MLKVPSKHIKEGTCKDALYSIHCNPGHLTINQLESIVISMFQAYNMLKAYWYNISNDGYISICRLLSIYYDSFKKLMLQLKLFYRHRDQV